MPRKLEKREARQHQLEEMADNPKLNPDELRSVLTRLLILKVSGTNRLPDVLKCVTEVAKLQGLYIEKKQIVSKVERDGGEGVSSWLEDAKVEAEKARASTNPE